MALTVIPAASGTITINGQVQKYFQLQLNTGKALVPVPAFGDSWETFIGGLKRANGQVLFYLGKDAADSNPFEDASGAMTITFDTGCTFGMNVITGDLNIIGSVENYFVATLSFAKNDNAAPTIAWDETGS